MSPKTLVLLPPDAADDAVEELVDVLTGDDEDAEEPEEQEADDA